MVLDNEIKKVNRVGRLGSYPLDLSRNLFISSFYRDPSPFSVEKGRGNSLIIIEGG